MTFRFVCKPTCFRIVMSAGIDVVANTCNFTKETSITAEVALMNGMNGTNSHRVTEERRDWHFDLAVN